MDVSVLKIIDCHNHSLPAIDDGAIDSSMALEMLKIAQQNGTTDIVLTPHHLNGAFQNFSNEVKKYTQELINSATKAQLKVRLHFGSEVHLTPETAEQLISNKALTYNGLGKAALIELPKSSIPTGVESILSQLIYHGITPIIAHPERNSSLRANIEPLKEWVNFGCKAQLTGQSCTGDFGQGIQRMSLEMITNKTVHLVASDAHRPTGRSPNLSNAATLLTEVFGEQVSKTLLYDNPLRLIKGEDLETLSLDQEHFNSERYDSLTNQKQKKSRKKTRKKSGSWLKKLTR